MVSGIECCEQVVRLLRISQGFIEVDESVEVARSPNPLVHGLSVRLTARSGMIVLGADEGQNGRANHPDAVHVSTGDDLLIGGKDVLNQFFVVSARGPHHCAPAHQCR